MKGREGKKEEKLEREKKDKKAKNRGMEGKKENWKQKKMFFGRKDFGKLFKLGLGRLSRSM